MVHIFQMLITQMEITLRYDNAIQTPIGTGLGTAVTRAAGTVVTG